VAVSRAYPTHLAGYGKMKTGHVGPHILREQEDTPPISIFWASPCFAGDSESYNPLWNLERSTGHVPHTIANVYYPELSGYFKESKPSSESVPIQEPTIEHKEEDVDSSLTLN
jgi:hypothetical protein